jgi:hypothetical protein
VVGAFRRFGGEEGHRRAGLDAEGITRDQFDLSVQAVRFSGPDRPYHWVDAAAQKRYSSLNRTFPDKYVDIESRSADNKRIVVEVDGASSPTTYYLVDYGAKSADIVGEQFPGLADKPQGAWCAASITPRATVTPCSVT